ncbi:Dynactin subunit 2-like isoform X1 [Oopsacas minuta]|uniref:Dynactin subunit 2-like isoform X1 n=1 Tax=Oopsacas minuta TaxID=111878 RepID=A0AAV7K803_9METZ|nr:Dynactin subunit 2-like isoform X1 [Oopsacas minuta]
MAHIGDLDKQLEIFETPDPPVLQQCIKDDTNSESVEEIRVGVKDGFEEFKNANIDTSKTDFSQIRPTGFSLDPWEYELNAGGDRAEGLSERYTRLEREISHLKSDLNSTDHASERLNLLQRVDGLEQQLSDVKLDKIYSEHISVARGVQGLDRTLTKNLLDTLHGSKKEGKEEDKGTITYELVLKPDDAKYIQAASLRRLEERLGVLEKIVGGKDDKIRSDLLSSAGESQAHSLMSNLTVLQRKCLALDQGVVGNLNQKAGELLQKIEKLKHDKEKQKDTPVENNKIIELFELTKRWDGTASALPDVLERLQTLKSLHESAAGFNLTLNHLEQRQRDVSESLVTNQEVLRQVSGTLEANMERIQHNFDNINKRIDALTSNS